MFINEIIIIQKYIRRFLIMKKILIPSSYYQTKHWRKARNWYNNGKSNECEKYQLKNIEKIINLDIEKTNERINIETLKIINKRNPLKENNGFEWTEDFDAKINNNNNIYYFNLKFVCSNGGAQTRTLREVYHFINYQLQFIKCNKTKNIFFINILDGDTCYNNINKFNYLLNKKIYEKQKKYIFIGSLYDFQNNIHKLNII